MAAADDFPLEYDDIVIGTGVQESIVAAALARNGHKVLHIDRNDYYSGEWASFNLKGMLDWIQRNQSSDVDQDDGNEPEEDVEEGLKTVPLLSHKTATNIEVEIHVREKADQLSNPSANLNTGDPQLSPSMSSEAERSTCHTGEGVSAETKISSQDSNDDTEEKVSEDSTHHTREGVNAETKISSEDSNDDTVERSTHHTGEGVNAETKIPSQDSNDDTVERSTHHTGEGVNAETKISSEDSNDDKVEHSTHHTGEEETSQEVIKTVDSNDTVEMVQNQSPTNQPVDESANETTSPNQQSTHERTPCTEEKQRDWAWEEIMKDWRKFNIDIAPKLMFCRGAMVELLVSSRISRYAEFKAVTRILTHINDKLEQVPCSRADVFSSRYVSVLEKRMLMRLIEFCLDHENRQDEYRDYMDKPFSDFLHSRKLSPTLQHFVIHSIAMTSANTSTPKALQAMKYFLSSLGCYGNTAFLWTMYGSGELPQCFCRMCAVFGGIYVLRTSVRSMVTDTENNIRGIVDSEGKRLKCRNLILEYSYTNGKSAPYNASYLSRGILITDRSIKQSTAEQITFLTIPPCDDRDQPVHVIEVGYAACAAPPNLYIVHLTSKASSKDVTAKDELQRVVQKFFKVGSEDCTATEENDKPCILWSVYFSQEDVTEVLDDTLKGTLPGNVYVTAGAGGSIGFDHAVSQAKEIFEKVCPGEEFLPPAPDPEDIVFDDPDKENTSQVGFEIKSTSESGQETSASDKVAASEEENETLMAEQSSKPEETSISEELPTTEEGKETLMADQCSKPEETSISEELPTTEEGKETLMADQCSRPEETSISEELPTMEKGKEALSEDTMASPKPSCEKEEGNLQ